MSPRVIAIVSGKGGSGKTMVSACLADVLASGSHSVLLVDADTGTAGLTYYLGVNYVQNTRVGISNVLFDANVSEQPLSDGQSFVASLIQRVRFDSPGAVWFLGIGDHRKLLEAEDSPEFRDLGSVISHMLSELKLTQEYDFVVVDCRGGIDADSLSICRIAQDVILVTEPDITAYQATRSLVNVLSDHALGSRLRGFYLNKVFQDPSYILSRGAGEFGCQPLAAIPYDIESTRGFFIGDLPALRSIFRRHVSVGAAKAYPDDNLPELTPWEPLDYQQVSLTDPDGNRGGTLAAAALLLIAVVFAFIGLTQGFDAFPTLAIIGLFAYAVFFGLLGSITAYRRLLGRAFRVYMSLFSIGSSTRSRRNE